MQPPAVIGILFLMDVFPQWRGGTERQTLEFLRRMDRRRFRPHLGCLRSVTPALAATSPCPVVGFDLPRLRSPRLLKAFAGFVRYCRRHQIRVVHTFNPDSNFIGTLWARLAGLPVVVSSRRNIGWWQTPGDVARLRFLRRFTTHYLANSTAAAAVCRGSERVAARLISVIPNGVDAAEYRRRDPEGARSLKQSWGFPPDAFVVGAVGNLREVKNHSFFIRAAQRLHQQRPQTRFVVVGEGPLRAQLEREIEAAGLSQKFVLAGTTPDVPQTLAAFDVAVLCSHSESLSNAILEYMAAGLPVVASRVGGITDALKDGVTGLLYPVDDMPLFLAALHRLCDDEDLRRRLGDAASAHVEEHFTWSAVMDRTESLYESLDGMGRRKRARATRAAVPS